MSKFMKTILAGGIAITMVLTLSLTAAFADDVSTGTDATDPATAAITKLYQMPAGTTTPTATFTFTFTKVSADGEDDTADFAAMPAIGNKTVSFTSADNPSPVDDMKTVIKNTGDMLPVGTAFPGTGIYIYEVVESQTGAPSGAGITSNYSQAEYELHVYVAEDDIDGTLFVKYAFAMRTQDDAGEEVDTEEKVDPTAPGTETGSNGFAFTNSYVKVTNPGGGDDPEDAVLKIDKMVTGELGSKTKDFKFDVTITNHSLVTTPTTYTGYIWDADEDDVVDSLTFTATPGTLKVVNLKHGQMLFFTDLPIGTSWVVNEQAASGYKPSVAGQVTGTGTTGNPLTTGNKLVLEAGSSVTFTNDYESAAPMGILLNNLPFILLILAAAGALIIFLVRRRSIYQV
jgi:hypothetical protein